MIAHRFHSSSDLRFLPQMRKFVNHVCTVIETKQAFVQGKTQEVALVEFEVPGKTYNVWDAEFEEFRTYQDLVTVRFVWPVSALVQS